MKIIISAGFLLCLMIRTECSREGLLKGYGNLYDDIIDGDVTIKYGKVPEWINGIFVHHVCGAFGDTCSKSEEVDRITHIFDCLSIGQSFKLENGRVSFYSRFYDSIQTEIYKSYNMNMSQSKVFWRTGYADFDKEAVLKHEPDFEKANKTKPKNVPHVTWWRVNGKAMAATEETTGIQIDVNNMEVIQEYPFKDDNYGYDGDYMFTNNPAHEHTDQDGVVWSNIMVFQINWWTMSAKQWRLVYKVVDDVRIPVTEIPYPDLSPFNCPGDGQPYSDPDARMSYLHSFAATADYIVLPENSYVLEPCSLIEFAKDIYHPYYPAAFRWEPNIPSLLRVIRKSDGKLLATIKTDPFFATHQMNSYEEDGKLYLDMLIFDDPSLYTEHTWVNEKIFDGEGFTSRPHRFIINMEDWSLERKDFVPIPQHIEMCHVREDYWGYKYKYAYWCHGIYYDKPQIIQKINVDTGEIWNFTFHEDQYPQEPWFVPRPGGTEEDDGVLLVQGFDGRSEKGFLVLLDAQTMTPVSFMEAPGMILFGFHVRFFPLDTQTKADVFGN